MSQIFTDPASGRPYTIDPATGQSRWLDQAPPPPPTYPQQQMAAGYPHPVQPAPKRAGTGKKILLWGGGGLVVLVVLASLAKGGSDTTITTAGDSAGQGSAAATSKAAAQKPAPAPAAAKVGTPVRDGKFQFTVTGTKTTKRVGDQYLGKTAQGQFLLVSVTVANIGDKANTFDSSAQKLFDAAGRQYAADGAAGIYLGEDAKSFLEQINPGNSVNGIIVFDIPAGASVDRIELHDSLFSGGATVKLVK